MPDGRFEKRVRRETAPTRRAVAVVAVIVLLVVVGMIIVGMVHFGARDQDLTVRRLETIQAFYAAEAGINMSIREILVDADEDLDGAIGTISDDGSDPSDPDIGAAKVVVTSTGAPAVLASIGRAGSSERKITTTAD